MLSIVKFRFETQGRTSAAANVCDKYEFVK